MMNLMSSDGVSYNNSDDFTSGVMNPINRNHPEAFLNPGQISGL